MIKKIVKLKLKFKTYFGWGWVLTTHSPQLSAHCNIPMNHLGMCMHEACVCGFIAQLQGHRVSWSYWQSQREKDTEKGVTAGLMADSSCLWSTLYSVHIKNLSLDESEVELERKVESKVERRWGFLMETSVWQGHSSSSISIYGLSLTPFFPVWMFTCLTCLQVTLPRLYKFYSFQRSDRLATIIKKNRLCVEFGLYCHINTHMHVCLTACLFHSV